MPVRDRAYQRCGSKILTPLKDSTPRAYASFFFSQFFLGSTLLCMCVFNQVSVVVLVSMCVCVCEVVLQSVCLYIIILFPSSSHPFIPLLTRLFLVFCRLSPNSLVRRRSLQLTLPAHATRRDYFTLSLSHTPLPSPHLPENFTHCPFVSHSLPSRLASTLKRCGEKVIQLCENFCSDSHFHTNFSPSPL